MASTNKTGNPNLMRIPKVARLSMLGKYPHIFVAYRTPDAKDVSKYNDGDMLAILKDVYSTERSEYYSIISELYLLKGAEWIKVNTAVTDQVEPLVFDLEGPAGGESTGISIIPKDLGEK